MNAFALRMSLRAAPRLIAKPQFTSIYAPALACRAYSATPVDNGIFETIKKDHAELKQYYDTIMKSNDPDEQVRYQNQFTWELARHSIGEEIVVYPAMEKHVPNGKDMAEKDRQEHRAVCSFSCLPSSSFQGNHTNTVEQVKEALYKFQKLTPDQPEFKPTLQELWDHLGQHIKEEETDDLVALEKALPDGDSVDLAKSFDRTKMFVPTRSHPSSPDRPPFETVMGLMAAPIDKVMDMFRKFPKDK